MCGLGCSLPAHLPCPVLSSSAHSSHFPNLSSACCFRAQNPSVTFEASWTSLLATFLTTSLALLPLSVSCSDRATQDCSWFLQNLTPCLGSVPGLPVWLSSLCRDAAAPSILSGKCPLASLCCVLFLRSLQACVVSFHPFTISHWLVLIWFPDSLGRNLKGEKNKVPATEVVLRDYIIGRNERMHFLI